MKVLLLSVALLFFTGAQGRYFWQQDEPQQKQTYDQTIQRILHDGAAIVIDIFESLDFEGLAKEFHLKENIEAAQKHTENLEDALENYVDEVWKKFEEKLEQRFPVFTGKVVPILEDFSNALEEQAENALKEFAPIGIDLVSGLHKHVRQFWKKLEDIAINGQDNVRAEIDKLRDKLHPYVDKVHEEYKAYHNHMEGELQKDYKELKERVQKSYENLKEHAKPHLENLKNKIPDRKELQAKIEELWKEMHDYIVSAE
ncbi:uncharacterized protein RB166_012522 isoform 1-T3 [Leptodactylus fuscus]|uniref:uncharacterized protein LOC142210524 n=1 Tax=Leptodactylus fuscus TaxID=238119 RepID=UPI003F4F3C8C